MKKSKQLYLTLLFLSPLFGCTSKQSQTSQFSYDNQDVWFFESGSYQSPIDINTSKIEAKEKASALKLSYNDSVSYDQNDSYTIKIKVAGDALIDGRPFKLQQFHFHAPSEHTIDGQFYPLEFHFVNQSQSGRFAVIGIFIKEGEENKAFQQILDRHAKKNVEELTSLDMNNLIPQNKSYYHYLGSLTTPPLSENVEWYVLSTPIEASKEQIQYYEQFYSNTNRKTQNLANRVILDYSE